MAESKDPPAGSKSRISTDETGHSVWDDTIKTANFELVSTQRLQQLLAADEAHSREAIEKLAAGESEGYLAEDSTTGMLRIIDDDALQSLLDSPEEKLPLVRRDEETVVPASTADDEDLSLVSTQALRKLFDIEDDRPKPASPKPARDTGGGFDPYDSG